MMQQPMAPQPNLAANQPPLAKQNDKKSRSPVGIAVGAVLIVVAVLITLALVITVVRSGSSGDKLVAVLGDGIKADQYQAVFLDSQDGQVYFGKLEAFNTSYYKLTDIYYVRVEQRIQPEGQNQQPQQNISLAKLGNELHGPEDVMYINRDHVLFWENLKEDGQVVKAIREYQKNPNGSSQQQSSQQSSGSTNEQQ